jgi:hypothetical protein
LFADYMDVQFYNFCNNILSMATQNCTKQLRR